MSKAGNFLILSLFWIVLSYGYTGGDNFQPLYQIFGPYKLAVTGGTFRTEDNTTDCTAITNSSSATLTIPAGSQIIKAYLFWAASNEIVDDTVTLNGTDVTADGTHLVSVYNTYDYYGAYADVTNLITGSGTYTLTNVDIDNGSPYSGVCGVVGAWALVVVYKPPTPSLNYLIKIWEGFKIVHNDTDTVTFGGFTAGNPVDIDILTVGYEGDPDLNNNETVSINGNLVGNNLWDSTSSALGGVTTYGLDIEALDASSYINAGDDSFSITLETGQDLIIFQVVAVYNFTISGVSGYVYEDINGDGDLSDAQPVQNAQVVLYDSGGNQIATTTTNNDGIFSFVNLSNGIYYVAVDSKSLQPSAGLNSGHSLNEIWAEQTYIYTENNGGSQAWGLCDSDADSTTPASEVQGASVCFGGRRGDSSDDVSSLSTAEHIVKVQIDNYYQLQNMKFGFSFNVVTNVNDRDDDPSNPRTCQGCLRQFIQNANAIQGANYMRFIPAVPLNSGNWWTITLNIIEDSTNRYALPPITDNLTTIDGTAYNYQDGTGVRNTNAGSISVPEPVGVDNIILSPYEKPELEINANDKGKVFTIRADNVTIQKIAIYNSQDFYAPGISVEDGTNVQIADNFVGSRADGSDPGQGSRFQHGVDLRKSSNVELIHNFIAFIDNTGVIFNGEGVVERNYIYKVGLLEECGDGITFEFLWNTADSYIRDRNNTVVRYNYISDTAAYGVESWGAPGAYTIENNTITNSGLGDENGQFCGDGNIGTTEWGGVRLFGSGSLVRKNKIYNNRGSGVVVVAIDNSTPSKNNEITQNRFYNNGGISIDLDNTHTDGVYGSVNPNGDLVTPNDGTKNPAQQNEGLDYPIFTTVEISSGNLHVAGRVGNTSSAIPETFRIEIYKADDDGNNNGEIESGDGLNVPHGEGRYYIGSCTTANDGTFDCTLPAPSFLSIGDYITAIAIDSNGNTSEFSANYVVSSPATITGYLYSDANHNSVRESGEQGIQNVRIELWYYDGSNWVLEATTTTDSNGYFQFNPLNTGRYRVIEDAQNSGSDANTGSDPAGYISTTANVVEVFFNGTQNIIVEFGDFHGSRVEGYSFEDKGNGTAASPYANNSIFDQSVEKGLEGVVVKACVDTNCSTLIETTTTDGRGKYELWIPSTYDGNAVYIIEETPNGYISTGDSKGSVVDSNYADVVQERDILTYQMSSGEVVTNYNFGNVKKVSIVPSINIQVDQGSSATISHRVNVGTPSVVAISYSSQEGWNYAVYNDNNCDGVADGNNIVSSGGFYYLNNANPVDVGVYCVILKVVAPSSVSQNIHESLDIIANVDWTNTAQGFDDFDSVRDRVTVLVTNVAGSGNLVLEKWVRNVTAGESFGKTNNAKPCDILEYRIDFKNIGVEDIQKLLIGDIIPVYTSFVNDSYSGYDVKIEIIEGSSTQVFYANLSDPGVELDSSNTIKVDVLKITYPSYTVLSPGVEGRLYYRVQLECNL